MIRHAAHDSSSQLNGEYESAVKMGAHIALSLPAVEWRLSEQGNIQLFSQTGAAADESTL
ncbi:hypothetical protein [Paenibacillus sp. FJAT-27812]|uniref:hypothetical protein n=1 Tax=Paenibacillus sp. FJAT-27812 TaxID=1684143 RepID=UPI000AA430E6|nr:hypothetical protein [Paenibacillus sp. FJAT-27812]